jgi:hypothetical protein
LNLVGYASYAWIGGGVTNMIFADFGVVGGGYINVVGSAASFSSIGGGYGNAVFDAAAFSTISGGRGNFIYSNSTGAAIGGGFSNVIVTNSPYATVSGGYYNVASGIFAVVGGGELSQATGTGATVGGGRQNAAAEQWATVGGGRANTASGEHSAVGGGHNNTANGTNAVVGGGYNNLAGGYSVVPGGGGNQATGFGSFAAGFTTRATNDGSFVWGGVVNVPTASTNDYSFTVRAPGGARFLTTTATNPLVGAILASGATSWAVLSDSNAKTDVEPVNAREVLKKVAALPVTSWHYKHDLKRRYIGPMAQDFHEAFGLGSDDKTITTLDTDGVTLAAIKGLVEESEARDSRIGRLEAENAEMRSRLQAIDERLGRLPPGR